MLRRFEVSRCRRLLEREIYGFKSHIVDHADCYRLALSNHTGEPTYIELVLLPGFRSYPFSEAADLPKASRPPSSMKRRTAIAIALDRQLKSPRLARP